MAVEDVNWGALVNTLGKSMSSQIVGFDASIGMSDLGSRDVFHT